MNRRRRRSAPSERYPLHPPLSEPESGWEDEEGEEGAVGRRGLRRAGRVLGFAGGGVFVLGALAVGVFPTHTFLDQRADTAEAQERLAVLRAQNDSLEERIARLGRDDEIERLAREEYNLAYPGEEAYAVLPAPLPPLELPTLWPFGPFIDPAAVAGAPVAP
jgi:cell division protein FtsB